MITIKESLQEYIGNTHYPYWLLSIQMFFFSIGLGFTNAHFLIFSFLLIPSFYVLSELIYDVKTNEVDFGKSFCDNSHYPRIIAVLVWLVIAYGFSFLHVKLATYAIIISSLIRILCEIIYKTSEKEK